MKCGFTDDRWAALWDRWVATTKMGTIGPITSFEPWTNWTHLVCMVLFTRVCSESCPWQRRPPGCRPGPTGYVIYHPIQICGLVRTLSLPAPELVCKPVDSPNGSGIPVQPALIDAHFRKAWMPYFGREGHQVVTPQAFSAFVGDHLHQATFLDMAILTGEEPHESAMVKKSTARGLEGGLGMRSRPSRCLGLWDWPWFCAR